MRSTIIVFLLSQILMPRRAGASESARAGSMPESIEATRIDALFQCSIIVPLCLRTVLGVTSGFWPWRSAFLVRESAVADGIYQRLLPQLEATQIFNFCVNINGGPPQFQTA